MRTLLLFLSLLPAFAQSCKPPFLPPARPFCNPPYQLRNYGISAHIDSGKTTLTERILFYTGRISAIHEVKGKDGVGATMDSMELERERGITIKSAATYCSWGDYRMNIIDTPGHVDFTIEVERALRVLDGAVMVLCGVSGVQSQSITVDRQMKRYGVPRVAFINKLDRAGANPARVVRDLRAKLRLNACAVQLPLGLEAAHAGVVDLISRTAVYFEGANGVDMRRAPVPAELTAAVEAARAELVERVAEVDDALAERFLDDGAPPPTEAEIRAAIRRAVISLKFVPVFLGSAYKNKGVQLLLDGVVDYLPSPQEKANVALDRSAGEAAVPLSTDPAAPVVALAFKLAPSRFGQLTYMRLYQGTLRRGDTFYNVRTGERVKVPRLVRMHSDQLEDIDAAGAGEILAMFGVDCATGDTFTAGPATNYAMTSMFVPEPVISYSIKPVDQKALANFSKALHNFSKEDPTFRSGVDPETGEQLISGMGELHLDVYIQLLRREYGVETRISPPRVNFRETAGARAEFNFLHRKQSGGAGQFARVVGYLEPLADVDAGEAPAAGFEFVNALVGNNIPPEYVPACEKGFREAMLKGAQIGHPVQGVRVVLTDGAAHAVDSNEMAFRLAAGYAFRQAFLEARPNILEPIMKVEVALPTEYQGTAIALLNKRKGQMTGSEAQDLQVTIHADVPLSQMFGFSTELRSATQGKGACAREAAAAAAAACAE
jgi:elongation factor G